MPVKKDQHGRRYVEAEVEVPGSPEEVWQAIATGKGISSWFVPTTSDGRVGGKTISSFGPGMDAVGTIREWNPPHRFVAEAEERPGTVVTEWIVEARTGGTCIVRVVHRWFAETDDWDAEFEGHAYGWATSFFRILQVYLTHFSAQKCSAFALSAFSEAPPSETWRIIKRALNIDEQAQRAASTPDAPVLAGTVESLAVTDPELLRIRDSAPLIQATLEGMDGDNPELLLRLDRPAPGIAHMFVMPIGHQTLVSMRFYLYGDEGAAAASHAEQEWSDWLAARFPEEGHA